MLHLDRIHRLADLITTMGEPIATTSTYIGDPTLIAAGSWVVGLAKVVRLGCTTLAILLDPTRRLLCDETLLREIEQLGTPY